MRQSPGTSPGLNVPESYSSRGLAYRLFDASGNRYGSPQVRQKPDVAGPDCVSTSVNFAGGKEFVDGSAFCGTSAAAAGVAGVATLILQEQPTYTPAQLYSVLENPAHTIDCTSSPGNPDYDCGYGFELAIRGAGSVISGNTGLGGMTLNYTEGTAKTVTSAADGSYSIPVYYQWSGTVTPSSSCATFTPTSLPYSNVTSNQMAQNYSYSVNSGCDGINVSIAGSTAGSFALPPQGSQRANFAGVNNGPVQVASTDSSNIVSSIRALVNGKSYSEMMGYPANQLTNAYVFPYYNDVDFDSQLRVTNVGNTSTTINVYLGSNPNPIDSYTLGAGAAVRKNYAGMSNGPMQVTSSATNILTTIRAWVNNLSYSELTGYPVNQLTNAYVFPYYNDVDFDSQLRVSNVGSSSTTINVYLGSNPNPIDTYTLAAGTALRKNYAGMSNGPMKVTSSATNILTTIRAYVNHVSYSELMGYPVNQLTTDYWYPVYDDVDLDSQLRVSNVGSGTTTITVVDAGGFQIDSYSLGAGQATRLNYAYTNTGPLHVVSSSQPILSTIRLWLASGPSYYEIMGLPGNQLTTQYWFPWYNSLVMSPEVRVAKP